MFLVNFPLRKGILEEKQNWYSPAAKEYNDFCPKYPDEIIQRANDIAHLSPNAHLLEMGAVAGAGYGYSIIRKERLSNWFAGTQQKFKKKKLLHVNAEVF